MECQLLAAAASAEHFEAGLFSSKGTWGSSAHHPLHETRTPHTSYTSLSARLVRLC